MCILFPHFAQCCCYTYKHPWITSKRKISSLFAETHQSTTSNLSRYTIYSLYCILILNFPSELAKFARYTCLRSARSPYYVYLHLFAHILPLAHFASEWQLSQNFLSHQYFFYYRHIPVIVESVYHQQQVYQFLYLIVCPFPRIYIFILWSEERNTHINHIQILIVVQWEIRKLYSSQWFGLNVSSNSNFDKGTQMTTN